MEKKEDNIFGFFASTNYQDTYGEAFRSIIWGDNGLDKKLKVLNWRDYGNDFQLILFEFYLIPPISLFGVKRKIENYRKKEKSIGIPIVFADYSIFELSESERLDWFKHVFLSRLELLRSKLKRNKLDLKLDKLKSDVELLLQ